MCEPRNRDNGASDVWALTAYYQTVAGVSFSLNGRRCNSPGELAVMQASQGAYKGGGGGGGGGGFRYNYEPYATNLIPKSI